MLKRISHVAKTPGVQLIGVLAVTQLLEAIGWVMEDGTYVKKIPDPNDPSIQYYYKSSVSQKLYSTPKASCDYLTYVGYEGASFSHFSGTTLISCYYTVNGNEYMWNTADRVLNPNYDPNKDPKVNTVPLTPALLGAAMLGTGYTDPDPSFDNSLVNNDQWTGVPEAYTPDDSDIGNELAEELENKADNAPQTPDGKSSSFTDPKYQNDLKDNDNANDRSWQSGDGTEGSTDSSQTTDPETGTTTNSGSFNLPKFCDWAMTVCDWYSDWKKSDQIQQDHMTKVEEHQTEEKSFWEDVKDWFDWTKEPVDEEPDTEEEEPDTQGIFDRTFDTAFSLSKECPPDIPFSLETEFFSGSWNISMNWLCIIFTFLGYPLVFLSHCVGLWILYEAVVQREIKW